ncbi:MAG: sorbosone dehydrogenase family protein [Bacillus sp. (in: Bacteria)]|nr:sorbosone dehydrogenase family protein [Bacillus sp. (in: firmicutes)]
MFKTLSVVIFAIFLLTGCIFGDEQPLSEGDQASPSDERKEKEVDPTIPTDDPEVIATNLEIPWSIEKHGDTFYITERPGAIVKIENGDMVRQRVELEQEISTAAEAGLLGFVLAPDFADSQLAFAYYTYEDGGEQWNRIVKLRLEGDAWREERILIDAIPGGTFHHGGRLKIGPDGLLYATTGDASIPTIAQEVDSLGGKILRLDLDGSIPEDNPFGDSYVYSYGHRNPQGLAWSSGGELYSSEHGSRANDEVNLIEAGKNFGWPVIEGEEEQEGMESPLFTSGSATTWAPSGMDYYDGKLYVAGLRGAAIYEFDLETGEHREFITGFGRIRDVFIYDNTLYFITNNTDGRGTPAENDDKLFQIPLT